MGLLDKVKSFFFDVKRDVKDKMDNRTILSSPPQTEIPQPKGDLIGQCGICQLAIGSDERVKQLKGQICHKRCVKKAQKALLNGEKLI